MWGFCVSALLVCLYLAYGILSKSAGTKGRRFIKCLELIDSYFEFLSALPISSLGPTYEFDL